MTAGIRAGKLATMKTGVTLAYVFTAGFFVGIGNLDPLVSYGVGIGFTAFVLHFISHKQKKSQKVLEKSGRVVVVS